MVLMCSLRPALNLFGAPRANAPTVLISMIEQTRRDLAIRRREVWEDETLRQAVQP